MSQVKFVNLTPQRQLPSGGEKMKSKIVEKTPGSNITPAPGVFVGGNIYHIDIEPLYKKEVSE